MSQFLLDINLPYYFGLWNSPEFIHHRDLNPKWSDAKIWLYYKTNDLTIITKDVDFSNKMMLNAAPLKVIHMQFGNLKMKPFYEVVNNLCDQILLMNSNHKLVNVFINRIEGID